MSLEKIKNFTENASPDNWLKYSEELKEVVERRDKNSNKG